MTTTTTLTGEAAGVPFVAVPPGGGPRPGVPMVVTWHLQDPPRTEAAMAAALPLEGLDAWRVYLGLPMSGARVPAGGPDEVMRLALEDAVLNVFEPSIVGAADEFPAALAELRERLGAGDGPLGLMGGSAGAAVAQLVVAEAGLPVRALVLVSPAVQLRAVVAANERLFGITYTWSAASEAVGDRLDFVARAAELAGAAGSPPVLLIAGEEDDPGITEPAAALAAALPGAELVTVTGMAHALAEEPGVAPAPQTAHAAACDRRAAAWFRRHLAEMR